MGLCGASKITCLSGCHCCHHCLVCDDCLAVQLTETRKMLEPLWSAFFRWEHIIFCHNHSYNLIYLKEFADTVSLYIDAVIIIPYIDTIIVFLSLIDSVQRKVAETAQDKSAVLNRVRTAVSCINPTCSHVSWAAVDESACLSFSGKS